MMKNKHIKCHTIDEKIEKKHIHTFRNIITCRITIRLLYKLVYPDKMRSIGHILYD